LLLSVDILFSLTTISAMPRSWSAFMSVARRKTLPLMPKTAVAVDPFILIGVALGTGI